MGGISESSTIAICNSIVFVFGFFFYPYRMRVFIAEVVVINNRFKLNVLITFAVKKMGIIRDMALRVLLRTCFFFLFFSFSREKIQEKG